MFPVFCVLASGVAFPVAAQGGWISNSGFSQFVQSKLKKNQGDIIPFSTFERERLSAQQQLPCKWITLPHDRTAGYDFLCKGGTWATVSYMLDRSNFDVNALSRARLLWRSWHPNAHPSGGEAHSVQPFLSHTIASLVPARIAEEVEYAFWQAESREWVTNIVTVRYTYDYRADHGLHKLEIIGRAPKVGLMAHDLRRQALLKPNPIPMQVRPDPVILGEHQYIAPQEAVPDVLVTAPKEPVESMEKAPHYQVIPVVPHRSGPAFMQEESVPSVETELPQEMVEAAIATPNLETSTLISPSSLEEMAEQVRIPESDPEPLAVPTYSGMSRGRIVPAYQPLGMENSSVFQNKEVDSNALDIPTLQKPQNRLDLGATLDIPTPPGSLVPYGNDTLNSDSLLEEANRIVPNSSLESTPLKNKLLQDYFEAEETTERYRDRAEGRVMEPLRENVIAE